MAKRGSSNRYRLRREKPVVRKIPAATPKAIKPSRQPSHSKCDASAPRQIGNSGAQAASARNHGRSAKADAIFPAERRTNGSPIWHSTRRSGQQHPTSANDGRRRQSGGRCCWNDRTIVRRFVFGERATRSASWSMQAGRWRLSNGCRRRKARCSRY